MAQSRIESDLSNNPVPSKSRIERILNGEEVIPRSRIESLLIGYNPEDPGDYHKVECTKAEYDNMSYHDPDTIYVVTYLDESIHFYLGDTEIAGNPTLIEKSITSNGIYDAEDDDADGYSIVEVDVSLPADIEVLEYIKTIGNSIIPTDIVPSYDWITAIDVSLGEPVEQGVENGSLLGTATYDANNELTGYYSIGLNHTYRDIVFYAGYDWSTPTADRVITYDSDEASNTMYLRRGSAKSTFGKESVQLPSSHNLDSLELGMSFFGVSRKFPDSIAYSPDNTRIATIYGVRLYSSQGALLHHLIPAQNKTINRGGLYDVITGTFYPSSSDFDDVVKGPIASKIPYVDAKLTTKTITANGTYNAASDNVDGYSAVTVAVPQDYIGVSCTAQEYDAMQTHSATTIYTVTDGTKIYKYLGDDPIGGSVNTAGWIWVSQYDSSECAGTFRGFTFPVTETQTSFTQPSTGLVFDRTKSWDIVVCVKLSDPANRGSNATGAIFGGGGGWPDFTSFPSAEMQSNGGIWFGMSSDGNGWSHNVVIPKATLDSCLVTGKNYLKFSYDGINTVRISHSSDSKTYTDLSTTTINFTPYNGQNRSIGFQFGAVSNIDFTATWDNHVIVNECKLYSDGTLIYGNEFVQKNFAT